MVIPGYSAYDITEDGVVTVIATGKVLKHRLTCVSGYYRYVNVTLISDEGKRQVCNVIRLLALTYLKKPEDLCVARAKDGDNTNAVLSNVEWVPYTEGSKQVWRRGQMANRKPRQSSVTEEFIALLYDTLCLFDEPVSMTVLSHELDVPYSTVRYSMYALIKRNKARKLITGYEVIR